MGSQAQSLREIRMGQRRRFAGATWIDAGRLSIENPPRWRKIRRGKNFFAALSFRFELCYYDAVIDLDPAIIWRYPTIQMYPAIQFALDRSLPNSEAS
jgi:hypothetical protein